MSDDIKYLFRKDVAKVKFANEGALDLRMPRGLSMALFSMAPVVIVSAILLSNVRFPVAVNVEAKIVSENGVADVYVPMPAHLLDVQVEVGDLVKEGDRLGGIVPRKIVADGIEPKEMEALLRTRISSLISQSGGFDEYFEQERIKLLAEKSVADSRFKLANSKANMVSEQIELVSNKMIRYKKLSESGVVPASDLELIEDRLLSLRLQLGELRYEGDGAAAVSETKAAELRQLPITKSNKKAEVESQVSSAKYQLIEVIADSSGEIRSPIAGVVAGVYAKKGNAIGPDKPVITITPKGSKLSVQLDIPVREASQVRTGQQVRVRIPNDSSAFAREINAIVEEVPLVLEESESANAEHLNVNGKAQKSVVVSAKLSDSDAKLLVLSGLKPGLVVDAVLLVSERSIADMFLTF